jgi:pimeloyl-ACP methyl ester carboxylesterase
VEIMKRSAFLVLLVVLMAHPAASQAPPQPADEGRAHGLLLEAINRGDVSAAIAQFTDDAVFDDDTACAFPFMCVGAEEIRPRLEALVVNRTRFSEITIGRYATTWTSWTIGRFQTQSEQVRAAGVERILQATAVSLRGGKIVSISWRYHPGDDQTRRFLQGQASPARPTRRPPVPAANGRLIDIGGRKAYIECVGTGTPTVVFEAGLDPVGGASGRTWIGVEPRPRAGRDVHATIGRLTRACTYDRPGIGLSDPGPTPRDGLRAVADLRALLRAAGERPPYVIVGWSLGAPVAYLFASQYRHEVSGLVLLDPTLFPFGYLERLWPLIPPELAQRDRRTFENLSTMWASPRFLEGGWDIAALSDHVRGTPALGDISLIVLTAGVPEVNPYSAVPVSFLGGHPAWPDEVIAKQEQVRLETHASLARRTPRGAHRILDNSHHMVFRFAPAAVTAAVLEVVQRAR